MTEELPTMAEALAGLRQLERWAKGVSQVGAALRLAEHTESMATAATARLDALLAEVETLEAQRVKVSESLSSEQAAAASETQALLDSIVVANQKSKDTQAQLAAEMAAARMAADQEIRALRKATEQELAFRTAAYAEQAQVHGDTTAAIEDQVKALNTEKDHLIAEIADLRRRVGAL